MAGHDRYTVEQVRLALEQSAGIYTGAAAKLKCAPNTVINMVKKHPELQLALVEIKEQNIDMAETQLLKAIRDGAAWAVCFYLKTQGKKRGYIERYEHTGNNGAPLFNRDETLKRIVDKLARREAQAGTDPASPTTH